MGATFTQSDRLLKVDTPLGKDKFLLFEFSGNESVSQLFSFQLHLVSDLDAIEPKKILGKKVTWLVKEKQGEHRFYNGFVSRFAATGRHSPHEDLHTYRAVVVPWLWFLTKTSDCRIFQDQTVPDIIQKVFKEHGFTDFELRLKDSYGKWGYCVQYRETAFNFVSRLMEQEGICYYFLHEEGKHKLILADSPQGFEPCAETAVPVDSGRLAGNHIYSWEHQYEFRSGKYTQTDYNFQTSETDLLATKETVLQEEAPDAAKYELFDFPGEYEKGKEGEDWAEIRMEEQETTFEVISAASGCRTFFAGGKFKLTDHDKDSENIAYAITSVQHSASDTAYRNQTTPGEYHNTFTCVPAKVRYRPARVSPKPVVQGVQSAVVVGPPGEEIHTDKYSRIKVQFFWDRRGKHDENSSCWIRVASIWAGKGYGMVNIPRIGQEVVVGFEEGDPDRPLVVGSVYNDKQMPPTSLPKEKMVGGLRSNSTPGGGGYNGLIFNDTKNKEMITLHGQKDMTTTIEHDDTVHIKNDRSTTIDHDETLHVVNDRTIIVDGKHTETINKDTAVTIKSGNFSHDVKTGTALYHVKGAVEENFDATMKITVKAAVQEQFQDSQETTVKNGIVITSTDAHIYIHTATSIQLHVGDSSIWMDSGGQIAIKGNNIAIEGKESVSIHGGMVRSKADSTHEIEGGNVLSEGKATNTVKAPMVMLNP